MKPSTPPGAPVAETYRTPYLAAAVAMAAVWALYAFTLAPTTWFWDTSEYIATANILGIPHPPGNPLFVVLARAWSVLLSPVVDTVAVRINLFSATMGALAHGAWFLLAHRIMSYLSPSRTVRLLGAAAAVLVSAAAFTVWNQSNVNEKVYTVSLFTMALISWLTFRWRDRLGEGKDDNLLLLIAYILALSVGNHLMAFLVAPALLVFILMVAPRTVLNWRLYAGAVVVGVLGLSVHLFLPIRAELDPLINEADPTCETIGSAVVSVVTMGRAGCEDLSAALSRQQYDKPSVLDSPVQRDMPRDIGLLAAQAGNYVQYFDWQWGRSVAGNLSAFGGARPMVTLLFVFLGLFGAYRNYQRDRPSFAFMAVLFLTLSAGLVFYLNFKYGFSYPVPGSVEIREVRERDYFFIVSFSVWGLWAGMGVVAAWRWLTDELAARGLARPQVLAAPVLLVALLPLLLNWSWASRHGDTSARDWAYNLLNSVEPYGVLFTNGDNDTFPLWYAQEVEEVRRDVTVIVMSYLNTPWYVRQLRDLTTPCEPGQDPLEDPTRILCQRPFQPENAPELYAQRMLPTDAPGVSPEDIPPGRRAPLKTILPFTDEQVQELAGTPPFYMDSAQPFQAGNIETLLSPGDAYTGTVIPSDLFLAAIIRQAIGDRPIYFAMTTQAHNELALRPYLIRHGLALKLHNGPVQTDTATGIVPIPQNNQLAGLLGPYIDLPRTEELMSGVFRHGPGFPEEWDHWVDAASEQIPAYYGYTHWGMALVYDMLGRTEDADRHMELGEQFIRLGELRAVAGQAQ